MMKKKSIVMILGLLLVSGCSNAKENPAPDPKPEITQPEENTNGNNNTAQEDFMDAKLVFDKASEEFPGAKVVKFGLDVNNRATYYEVEAYLDGREIELRYDAFTGEQVRKEIDTDSNNDMEIAVSDIDRVDEFSELALADAGSSYTLKEWKIEGDYDRKIIELEVQNDKRQSIEYTYDLESGKLLEKDM